MKDNVKTIVNEWLVAPVIDINDKESIQDLIKNKSTELEEAFYTNLDFGTGGLRGIMGIGTNRMNKYTVGMATQGLCNYLLKQFSNKQLSVAIAYDSRINSRLFCDVSADVLSANNIHVFIFDDIKPTPLLSFAVRFLSCDAGIVITASHNPKEYNGYKVYWNDGGQLVPPHDKNIIEEVRKIKSPQDVNFRKQNNLIQYIDKEVEEAYFEKLKTLVLRQEVIEKYNNLKIVYSPLHGTGYKILPEALRRLGFRNITEVEHQNIPDGNFPTVVSPNPEEKTGMEMARRKAMKIKADLFMATDPDADRLGIGIRLKNGEYQLLDGNQAASLITYYMLKTLSEKNKLDGNQMIVKTIVTTDLLTDIADRYSVKSFNVLTGFKYVGEVIRKYENIYKFICGGEESYGFLAGDFVRDKDGIIFACVIAEVAAWAASENKTLADVLKDIALEFGLYKDRLVSITKKGIKGMQEITSMMEKYRNNIPETIAGKKVVKVYDYQKRSIKDIITGEILPIDLPQSNVIQYLLEDMSKITIRPSGTEPKIKFYFSVKRKLDKTDDYETLMSDLDDYIEKLKKRYCIKI